VDRCHQLGYDNVIEIQFGASAPDVHFANMRSWMWSKVRDFLPRGSIDTDTMLETDLTGPGYHFDRGDRLLLESKENMAKRGLDSPDDGDALALTFAQPVAPAAKPDDILDRLRQGGGGFGGSWMS
jgi:hypothetical protein